MINNLEICPICNGKLQSPIANHLSGRGIELCKLIEEDFV